MQTAYTSQISRGVTLTCVKTEKFKTGCLSVSLICALSAETAAMSALLPRVLRRGTNTLPDMEKIAEALDELYGARIEPMVRKKGELHCVGFYSDFPDDRFIPGGSGDILEQAAGLMGGILLSPATENGLLRADYVEGERKNLIDDIRAGINDKRGYAVDRLLEQMCAGEAFGVNRLGGEREAAAITPETLTAHYKKLLATSEIEAFYCGPAEPARVEAALRKALSGLPERKEVSRPAAKIIFSPEKGAPRRFTEALDVAQGKLTVGFRLGKAMERPNYPAFMVFNAVYGGNVTSKLFLNVREKLSLCYYASSMLEKHKGVMLVMSGVEFAKFEEALSEILAQLGEVKSGNVTDLELVSAKRSVITAIKSAMDRPAGLEDLYFDRRISAVEYDPEELSEKVEAVTLSDVVSVASEIRTDSIYFLTGKGGGDDEA